MAEFSCPKSGGRGGAIATDEAVIAEIDLMRDSRAKFLPLEVTASFSAIHEELCVRRMRKDIDRVLSAGSGSNKIWGSETTLSGMRGAATNLETKDVAVTSA